MSAARIDPRGDPTMGETAPTRTGRSQARGRQRRAELLTAARQLLAEHEIDEVSLHDLARAAGIPTGSAYHFYANAMDAFAALAEQISAELEQVLAAPLPPGSAADWEDVLAELAGRAVAFYRERPDAQQLLLGVKTPPEFKLRDRENDRQLGLLVRGHIAAAFELPALPQDEELYFHAVEIIDLFYVLSVVRHGEITDAMAAEALRAAVAYLRTYLPAVLPAREAATG
ncbi:TetR/AcrR family transcriptional regulator [Streptomyces sp. NPDC001914]|uniref:TetR/AcrR family transcriptional regulator n=1 Tax=Streptomyces sp. NPDC001914 TaxID=3364623 RepID=UPI003692C9D9